MNALLWRDAIGLVLYIYTRTRSYIAVAVRILLKHSQTPSLLRYQYVKCDMWYLKVTQKHDLVFQREDDTCMSIAMMIEVPVWKTAGV